MFTFSSQFQTSKHCYPFSVSKTFTSDKSYLKQQSLIMATEGKLEEPQMEQNIAQIQEREKEPSKDVNEKGAQIENVVDEAKKNISRDDDEHTTKEIGVIEEKKDEAEIENATLANGVLEKSSSLKEESHVLSDLKEHEKQALLELKSKIEEAILTNNFMEEKRKRAMEIPSMKDGEEETTEKQGEQGEQSVKEDMEEKEKSEEVAEKEKEKQEGEKKEGSSSSEGKEEDPLAKVDAKDKDIPTKEGKEDLINNCGNEKAQVVVEEKGDEAKEDAKQDDEVGQNVLDEGKREMAQAVTEEKGVVVVDRDIALWGVPLLPSKGDERTDIILLKFLRAREFKVNDTFEMLRKTLQWRKESNIDSVLVENFDADLGSVAYMEGNDREGHPICYNVFGVLGNDELYRKLLGNEEKQEKFLRWRIQLMENGIQKLDFKPGCASRMLQITDLKNSPLPTKRELRLGMRKAVELLQDNYPEFVAKNIFINVPFWYYAFSALLSPFLTQRTKNKFVYARASKATETLLKYIAAVEIPVQYGGLKRENDLDFSVADGAKETFVKAASIETIEIPAPEVGNTLIWDLTVSGWEVNYKEEFVPTDEGSYTIIVQKGRKISWQEESIRNSFKNNETGKVVITIENGSFKKKRIMYRYKTKSLSSAS